MMCSKRTLVLIVSILLMAACDTSQQPSCPQLSELSHFPLEVGSYWIYDLVDGFDGTASFASESRERGATRLEVQEIGECVDGRIEVQVREEVSLVDEFRVYTADIADPEWEIRDSTSYERTLQFAITDKVFMGHLALASIPVEELQGMSTRIMIAQERGDNPIYIERLALIFEQGIGLISYASRKEEHRDHAYRQLTLIETNLK